MATFRLLDLSYDLTAMIISYVIRPTDLKNVCLSCKTLRNVAARQLYRKVELDIGNEDDLKISAFLNRNNPGLEHIRVLVLNSGFSEYPRPVRVVPRSESSSPPLALPPPQPGNMPALFPPQPLIVNGTGGGLPPPPPPPQPGMMVHQEPRRRPQREIVIRRWNPVHFTVRLLIDLLPENILHRLVWQHEEEFSVENLVLLCRKQKKLKGLEVGPLDKSLNEALDRYPDLVKNLTELHALKFYPSNLGNLQACHRIMRDTPKLNELWIESAFDDGLLRRPADDHDEAQPQSWNDESNRPGLITSTLFQHKLPFQQCQPMALRELVLHKINVRWAAQTYMRVIDFPSLEILIVHGCGGADALFAEMAKPAKRPRKLQELTFIHASEGRGPTYVLSALENFLQSVSSLKKLCILFLDGDRLPRVEAICRHAATLEVLMVHSAEPNSYAMDRYYSKTDFGTLCRECTKVRQLAIGCPSPKLLDAHLNSGFTDYVDHALSLPNLVTLNLTSWPVCPIRPEISFLGRGHHHNQHRDSTNKPSFEVYAHLVRRVVQAIFNRKAQKQYSSTAMTASVSSSSASVSTWSSASSLETSNANNHNNVNNNNNPVNNENINPNANNNIVNNNIENNNIENNDNNGTNAHNSNEATSTTNQHVQPSGNDKNESKEDKLRLIAIGTTSRTSYIDNVTGSIQQLVYMRGTAINPFGQVSKNVAMRIKPASAAQYILPEDVGVLQVVWPDGERFGRGRGSP
ncbi:MAG: hypothetical protein M1823_002493 [Watsoniomyces obsoletus]|nr:MAG: hypothetical protein M1823_002493 [Watsoniomyces obsoletus]